MFYPVESLKRGGRFYLCWVADSWPLRFATITHRQLWSQDVRKICDDLMEVMSNESGRPTNRFSLRLSSQLMRGLARLYQKKVNVFLSDLCMINANVAKHANKKYNISEGIEVRTPRQIAQKPEQLPQVTLPEEPEIEQRIEEIIQNSGNVVTHIQDITLKEATIPVFQLPPNDGFGEENQDQTLNLLADRTMEQMMVPTDQAHQSGLDLALDTTDKSHDSRLDKSRLMLNERQMERISEHDVTMFLKPDGEEIVPGGDFEKEIQIPEIPDIPIPEIPIPPQEQLPLELEIVERDLSRPAPVQQTDAQEPAEIELEDLEEPQAKRRRLRKLIIDKKIKIGANTLRARIDNPNVELRCEDSSDDIIEIRVPCDVYMRRPCHAGAFVHSNLSVEITRLFMRNLGIVHRSSQAECEFQEEIMRRPRRPRTTSMLGRIEEVEEPIPNQQPQNDAITHTDNITHPENTTRPEISFQDVNFSKDDLPQMDISEMLTQKIDTLSQQAAKRKIAHENVLTPKKQRSIGYVAFRESQHKRLTEETGLPVIEPEKDTFHTDRVINKENIPENMQDLASETRPSKEAQKSVTAMLQEAGLADIPTHSEVEPVTSQRKSPVRQGSERSETPLGSLDRTKVSLGDSVLTTDSMRFIRDQWGTEGTMLKILKLIKAGSDAINVRTLIINGPVVAGYKAIIAARCFTSILKLKQHGFITIKKCPDTLEIQDIYLGSKFD